jgi:hypothetical protein
METNGRTLEMLQGIWNEMKTLNSRVNATNERLDRTNERLDKLTLRVDAGFARVDLRFDHLLLGEHGREHREMRERIARLEQHTGLPPPATSP